MFVFLSINVYRWVYWSEWIEHDFVIMCTAWKVRKFELKLRGYMSISLKHWLPKREKDRQIGTAFYLSFYALLIFNMWLIHIYIFLSYARVNPIDWRPSDIFHLREKKLTMKFVTINRNTVKPSEWIYFFSADDFPKTDLLQVISLVWRWNERRIISSNAQRAESMADGKFSEKNIGFNAPIEYYWSWFQLVVAVVVVVRNAMLVEFMRRKAQNKNKSPEDPSVTTLSDLVIFHLPFAPPPPIMV